jgi:hypothetical protein
MYREGGVRGDGIGWLPGGRREEYSSTEGPNLGWGGSGEASQ